MCHAGATDERGDKSGCGIYNPAGLRELFEIEMEMAGKWRHGRHHRRSA